MKKALLTAAIFSAILVSCNDNKSKNEHAHEHHDHETMAEHGTLDNEWVNDMALNGDELWEANPETNEGVAEMIRTVEESDPQSVAEYHELAHQLNETKNYVVKECTMVGESHEYLHVFLHPLIEKIDALGKVSTVDEGAEIREQTINNLHLYHEYFQ